MKNIHIFSFIFVTLTAVSIFEVKAQDQMNFHPDIIKKTGKYEFYVTNGKNKFLVKKDTFDEGTYYASRKIPADIEVRINSYNTEQLIITWMEDNVTGEGETGSNSEISRFIKIINIKNGKQLLLYRYYFEEYSWIARPVEDPKDGEDDIKREEHKNVVEDLSFTFEKNLIVFTDKKSKKTISFTYNPRKGYIRA